MFTRPHWSRWNHLLQFLPWRQAALRRPAPHLGELDTQADEDDRPLGCGWFDSSHDLQHGLQVQEADGQALAQLPLADWLALQAWPGSRADTCLDAGMIADLTLHQKTCRC